MFIIVLFSSYLTNEYISTCYHGKRLKPLVAGTKGLHRDSCW